MLTKTGWTALVSTMIGLTGCGAPPETWSEDDVGVPTSSTEQSMKNAMLLDYGGAMVETRIAFVGGGTLSCTASLINQNSLMTAARCGNTFTRTHSGYQNVAVLAQEDSTTWRCLTNLYPDGSIIRGTHASVLGWCTGRQAFFASGFDFGQDIQCYPSSDCAYVNDFAVVRVMDPAFSWYGSSSYLPLHASTVEPGWNYAFGQGIPDENGPADYRMRLAPFYVDRADSRLLRAQGLFAQICSGDSGGPLGYWVPNGAFPVRGVATEPWAFDTNEQRGGTSGSCQTVEGHAFWINVSSWIWFVEGILGKTCRTVTYDSVITKECWD